jgi:hypothetical protein
MKHIKPFKLIQEADDAALAPTPEPQPVDNQVVNQVPTTTEPVAPELSEPEIQNRKSMVVLKEFLAELRTHLIYWFKYGKIKDSLIAINNDITKQKNGLCVWADDTNGKYLWKITFLEHEVQGMIKQIEKLLFIVKVYDTEREYLIKKKEVVISVDDMNEDFLIDTIEEIKNSILKIPKSDSDVKKFKDFEKDSLTDDIY